MTDVGMSLGSRIALAGPDGEATAARAEIPVAIRAPVLEVVDAASADIAIGRNGGIAGAAGSKSSGDSQRLSLTDTPNNSPDPLCWRAMVSILVITK